MVTLEELQEELLIQHTLIESLDFMDPDYSQCKIQIDQEIAYIERQIQALQGPSTAESSAPSVGQPGSKRARAYSSLFDNDQRATKSQRTSPDRFTNPYTDTSDYDEDEDELPDDLFLALGKSESAQTLRKATEEVLRKAAEREKESERRQAQARTDEAYARKIAAGHNSLSTPSFGGAQRPANRPYASNGSLVQSSLTPNGMLQRSNPSPFASFSASQPSQNTSFNTFQPKTSQETPVNRFQANESKLPLRPHATATNGGASDAWNASQMAPQMQYGQRLNSSSAYSMPTHSSYGQSMHQIKAEPSYSSNTSSSFQPYLNAVKPEAGYPTNNLHVDQGTRAGAYDIYGNPVKPEQSTAASNLMYNIPRGDSSSSSLEEISAAEFRSNPRYSQSQQTGQLYGDQPSNMSSSAVIKRSGAPIDPQFLSLNSRMAAATQARNPAFGSRDMPISLDELPNNAFGAYSHYSVVGSSLSSAYGAVSNNFSALSRGVVAAMKRELQIPGMRPQIPPARNPAYDTNSYLFADSSRSHEEVKKLLDSIRGDAELPAHMRKGTPEQMDTTLLEHQKLGLTWLTEKEEKIGGSILADDMGLGKTIQAIALMVSRPSDNPRRKTTLIIAPVALLSQWEAEIEDKIKKRYALSVYKHHKKQAKFDVLRTYDVVLTTFGSLTAEWKRYNKLQFFKKENPGAQVGDDPKYRLCLIGEECKWHRIIIDEAQNIKNRNAQCSKAVCLLQSTFRLCMTGTPMMNNVDELYPLLRFTRIRPYNEWDRWNNEIGIKLRSQNSTANDMAVKKLQALIRATMLRRTKTSQLDGKPLITLPERIVEDDGVSFFEEENKFYTELQTTSQAKIKNMITKGVLGKKYSCALVLLLRLRQACNHHHLVFFGESIETLDRVDVPVETMVQLAKELAPDVVERIRAEEANFECPICFDATENPAILLPCGHWLCLGCFTGMKDSSAVNSEDHSSLRCPQCRGQLNAARITDFQAFKQVHQKELLTEVEKGALETNPLDDDDESESDSDTETESEIDSEIEDETLGGFIVGDCETEDDNQGAGGEGESRSNQKQKQKKVTMKKFVQRNKGKKPAKATAKEPKGSDKRKSLAQLKKEGQRNKASRRRYFKRLEKFYEPSAKISRTIEILNEIQSTSGHKTLIFSQFTSFLDILEVGLRRENYTLVRYDGSMSTDQRAAAVEKFRKDATIPVMLLSLKAGNAGLNLNFASEVLILDPFWNPFVEEQAMDRAHRIGQRHNVHVRRVVVPGTVEDRILTLQEEKRSMINTALDENAGKNIGRLGTRELAFLFGLDERGRELPAVQRDMITASPSRV